MDSPRRRRPGATHPLHTRRPVWTNVAAWGRGTQRTPRVVGLLLEPIDGSVGGTGPEVAPWVERFSPQEPHMTRRDRTEYLLRDLEDGRPVEPETAEERSCCSTSASPTGSPAATSAGGSTVTTSSRSRDSAWSRRSVGSDRDSGSRSPGFAAPTISGEIKRHFRDAGWMVRPPRRLQELGVRMREAEKDLEQNLHRRPTPEEIAAALECRRDPGPGRPRGGVELPRPLPGRARRPRAVHHGGGPAGVGRPVHRGGRQRLAAGRARAASPTASGWCCACASSTC